MTGSLVIVLDDSVFADLADWLVNHATGSAMETHLLGVDRPATDYSTEFGSSLSYDGNSPKFLLAAVNSHTMWRAFVDREANPALDVMRGAVRDDIPVLFAVSDLHSTQVSAQRWGAIRDALATTSATWLDLAHGEIRSCATISAPPLEFELDGRLIPPYWAEPWSWEPA